MVDYIRTVTVRDEDGASAVEYGLLIAGVAALIVAAVFLFGGMVADTFSHTCKSIDDQNVAHGGTSTNCS